MKIQPISILLFLFTLVSFGQNQKLDSIVNLNISHNAKIEALEKFSLKILDETASDDFKVVLNKLIEISKKKKYRELEPLANLMMAEKYKRNRNLDSSLNYISKSIKQIQILKNDSLLQKAYNAKGGIYNHFQNYDSASVYFQKSIKIGETSDNLKLLGYSYHGYSSVLTNKGYIKDAIEMQQKSLDISSKNKFQKLEIINLTGLGWKLLRVGNNEKSLAYLEEAYNKYNPNIVDEKEVLCDILRFMTLNYRRSGKYNLVEKYGNLGVECFKSTGNVMLASDALNTIGTSYLEQEKFEESKPIFQRLIKISDSINSPLGVNYGKINLSSALINLKEFNNGERLLLEILKDTIQPKFLPKRIEKVVHQNLAEVYELKRDYKKGLFFHKKFKYLEDSLNASSSLKEISEIDVKYQTEKKEKELAEQKIANQEQELLTQKANTRNWLLALGVLMAIMSAFFIWRKYKSEAKAKETINEQKNLVETLQKELHHRMKNNLSFIDLFINLAKGRFKDEAYQTKLNELQNRMRSMFEVHKQLFKKDDVTSVKAKSYIDTLVSNVQEAYAKDNISISNKTDTNETILADTSFPVGLIVNEFVTNSYKYAFDDDETGLIDIVIKSENEAYRLLLKDNGKGLPKDFDIDNLDSFGMETIQLLTKEYGGTISIDGSNGVSMNITLPKTAA